MTRDEIKNTPEIVDYVLSESLMAESKEKLHKRLDEICNLAIKALEKEPCEDAISRQAVLNIIDSYSNSQSNVGDVTQDCISDVMVLSSVQPKAKPKTDVLDKITAEIAEKENALDCVKVSDVALKVAYIEVLKIIDKYRQEE